MTVCKGDVWLTNLNPQKRANEIGKTRPVVVIQTDLLNQTDYPTVIVMPMTTQLIDNAEPLRYRINARAQLHKDSDVLIAHIRAIDRNRLIKKVADLKKSELRHLKTLLDEILE